MKNETTFDANERIAGFSLLSIKKVLQSVGIMDDRDDVENVSTGLKCGRRQAQRVLEELERRQFVEKTDNPRQWKTTRRGHELAFYWKPPRRLRPVVERESRTSVNTMFALAPCLILRTASDDDVFEEASIDAGMNSDYEGDHLVEINLSQPDDYDDPEGSAGIETSLYLSPSSAKTFVDSLARAIEEAEREIVRRQEVDARRDKRKKARWEKEAHRAATKPATSTTSTRSSRRSEQAKVQPPPPLADAAAPDAKAQEERRKAVSSALKELRDVNRTRRSR